MELIGVPDRGRRKEMKEKNERKIEQKRGKSKKEWSLLGVIEEERKSKKFVNMRYKQIFIHS